MQFVTVSNVLKVLSIDFSCPVGSVNKSYFAGEYDWVGSADDGVTPRGDSLTDWFKVIEQSPVAVGDAFWSLFGHNVPDCTVSVPSLPSYHTRI